MHRDDNNEVKRPPAKMSLGRYKYVPLILNIIAILTLLVSIATDYWCFVELSPIKQTNEGLWRVCIAGRCGGFSGDIKSWFQAVRAFLLLSLLTSVMGIVFFFVASRYRKLTLIYASAFLVSCLLAFFSLALYSIKQNTDEKKILAFSFGYSYICGWLSGTLLCVSAIVGFYDVRRQPLASTAETIEITVSSDSLEYEEANVDE